MKSGVIVLTQEEMIEYIRKNWDRNDEMLILPEGDHFVAAFAIDAEYVRKCEAER